MKLQEEYDLNIFLDDLNIFEAPGVVFGSAEITEAISNPIPSCRLELSIPLGWYNDRTIVDGTKLVFEIRNSSQQLYERLCFRVCNLNEIKINDKFVSVKLEGVIDFYDGYQEANKFNMKANSSDVFKEIAKAYELRHEIDDTNDSQLWISGEDNLYQFMTKMSQHGWINETSAMYWCLDRHKILLYKNLTDLFRQRSNNIGKFIQGIRTDAKEKTYAYSKADVSIQAGFENIVNGGYGGTDSYFDLLQYDNVEVAARKVIAESNLININKELSNGLANSYYPFDVGNFHKNYYLAKKQNARILSTYSTYVNLAAQYFLPYRLGQIVNFTHMDSQDPENKIKSTSGVYAICAIKIKMNTSAITCNLQLVMQGLNGTSVQETY